jgi:hypothetical protein
MSQVWPRALFSLLWLAGCAADDGSSATASDVCPRWITGVVSHAFGPGQNVGQARFPELIFGPPHGGGCCEGNANHVVSLGNGGSVTLEFGQSEIVDGPGPDFIVFENAFQVSGDATAVFAELASVEVSADGETWLGYECSASQAPYGGCAGVGPVYANPEQNELDPLDPLVAGGDAFDLADLPLSAASLIRITDRPDLSGTAGVFDLDAVGLVNVRCR